MVWAARVWWGRRLGQGARGHHKDHLAQGRTYETLQICKPVQAFNKASCHVALLSGTFSLARVSWSALSAPGLGNPWLHRFPPCVTELFHRFQGLQLNSRSCQVRWRESYKPLLHHGEDKSIHRHCGSTSLRRAAEDLCTRKAGRPLGQHLLLLRVGRGEHIIQFILMSGAATLLSSTDNDLCLSFGTVFLNALPQLCLHQPGGGSERGATPPARPSCPSLLLFPHCAW